MVPGPEFDTYALGLPKIYIPTKLVATYLGALDVSLGACHFATYCVGSIKKNCSQSVLESKLKFQVIVSMWMLCLYGVGKCKIKCEC